MSDIILKFWPRNEVEEVKTERITSELKDAKVLGEPTEFSGKAAFKPGQAINDYFEPKLNSEWAKMYFPTIVLTVADKDYGVLQGEEDFEYVDRLNVISIIGGEAAFENWDKMCEKLKSITGDDYEGGWELL